MRLHGTVIAILAAASAAGCSDFDTTRDVPPRGTLGQELYIAVCDRVAAQALPEDVTGASWHAICHPDPQGNFASSVDQARLPPFDPNARNVDGGSVPMAAQVQDRAYSIARIEALAKDRKETSAAFDAAFPDVTIALKDLGNADPTRTCDPAGTGSLHAELAHVLGRMVSLEDDGTVPLFTEALGHVMQDVSAAPDAQAALARFDARQGYRPLDVVLGTMRPVLAYPGFVPMARSLLSLVSSQGKDAPQMQQLLEVGRQEMRASTATAPLGPLTSLTDPLVPTRALLSRPRTTLELTRDILLQQGASFDVGMSPARWVVQRDPRAYAAVPLVNGAVPQPFVDADGDKLPDVDALGQFVTSTGKPVASPFFSPDGVDGPRDSEGRAVGQTSPTLYGYVNVGQTFGASLLNDVVPLVDPDPTHAHETLANAIGGAYVLFGQRDKSPTSTRQYPPDPESANPAQPVTLHYSAFHPETSPIEDLVYALGALMSDPVMDDLLQLGRQLMAQHPDAVARLVGLGLRIKAIADAHPEAHIPAASTFWDEMLDVIAQIAHVQDGIGAGGLLEDLFLSFGQDATASLQQTFAAYIQYADQLTYNHNSTTGGLLNALNGPAWNLTSNDTQPLHVPVDRTKPDVGANQSALQRFLQLLHDGKGLDICTKAGAVAHVTFDLGLGAVSFDYPTDALSGTACALVGAPAPPNPMPQCGILRLQNVDALLLDVVLGRATFDIRDPCLKALMNSPVTNVVGGVDLFLETQSGIAGFDTHPTVPGVARLIYFDTPHDTDPGDTNPNTQQTLTFLSGILDPVPTMVCNLTPFTDTDGTVLNLRACNTFADTIRGRDPGAIFPVEEFGFVQNVQPLAMAFDNHNSSLLFVDLFDTLDLHWADAQVPTTECDPTLPRTNARWCPQDGMVSYEPLLADVLTQTDVLQVLHDTIPVIASTLITHCDAQDPATHECTKTSPRNGVQVLSQALRVMVDPALNQGLTDSHGVQTAPRNDGTTNPQVTPMYLFIDALKGFDSAFAAWAQANPSDDRQPAWKAARSQLVDEFFSVNGTGPSSSWANTGVSAIFPPLLDAVESQIVAQCPDRSSRAACTWWTEHMPQNLASVVSGPTFAAVMGLLDAVRQDPGARQELEKLVQYLMSAASPGDVRATAMTAAVDVLQILNDDANLTPLYRAGAGVFGGQVLDDHGNVVRRGLAGAGIEALARIFAATYGPQGQEVCSKEIDPNAAMDRVLASLVTPMSATQATPLEVLSDVVADVNRAFPGSQRKLDGPDYANISTEISEFCLDPGRGLEQVYAVVRAATE